ncbi:MAG TPA: Gfo/Idh/MocA family oxidoreductase [Bacillota bacterium]|nr:Gfo/Idh/MocA family oxidoreductase [Bacillota bacterium]
MDKVRIGIIGLGNSGVKHAEYLLKEKVPGGELSAVCVRNPSRHHEWIKSNLDENVQIFDDIDKFLAAKVVDGILVATPHYSHPAVAIQALEKGYHVLLEKPAGVYTKNVRELNNVALKNNGLTFGMMYNQRANPLYQKLRDLIQAGELGEIKRINWLITNWYRPQNYYDSSSWRATWAGEGGGVLINQAFHQLDLWQWICGMPKRMRAFCALGKYHQIEVEDDVTAYMEYPNGATGVFITSTGEAPGSNRFELSGEQGKIVIEDGQLNFWRLQIPERQFNQECKAAFGKPECSKSEIPVQGPDGGHAAITANWVAAILHGAPLLAPGVEGIKALEISNAMYLSAWTDNWVELPIDEEVYYVKLQEKIQSNLNPR